MITITTSSTASNAITAIVMLLCLKPELSSGVVVAEKRIKWHVINFMESHPSMDRLENVDYCLLKFVQGGFM